jgi:hypothetical protein
MAATFTIEIETGIDYEVTFIWKDGDLNPIDVRGYKGYAQIRKSPTKEVLLDISPFINTTHSKGEFGEISLVVPATSTEAMDSLIRGVYDIKMVIEKTKEVFGLISGFVNIKKTVTRITL